MKVNLNQAYITCKFAITHSENSNNYLIISLNFTRSIDQVYETREGGDKEEKYIYTST